MKILIIGSSGSLGKKLFKLLKKKHQITHTGLKKRKYNLNNKKIIKNLLKIGNPEIVINCAGIVNIDECEKYKTLAYKSNYLIVKNFIDIIKKNKMKIKFVQISTDHIYDNNRVKIKNSEKTKPIINNYYSLTKIMSEKICLKHNGLVLRVNFIVEKGKKSFLNLIYNRYISKKIIYLAKNQFISALSLETLSRIISKNICAFVKNCGIFNIGSKDSISKRDIAFEFFEYLKIKKYQYLDKDINEICVTKRSKNMSMNVIKFEKKFNIELPMIRSEIKKIASFYK